MIGDPFEVFEELLEEMDSHDGRLARRKAGGLETDSDFLMLLPTYPGRTIFTMGHLRKLVMAGRALRERERRERLQEATGSPAEVEGSGARATDLAQ